jgi:hypothetical protein
VYFLSLLEYALNIIFVGKSKFHPLCHTVAVLEQCMCLTGRLICTSAKKLWPVFPHEVNPAQALMAIFWCHTVLLRNNETQHAELRQKVFLSYAVEF